VFVGRFPSKYERFCVLYVPPNHLKSRNKRNGVDVQLDESKQCPFVKHYDGHLHDVLANLHCLDGNIETHPQYGVPVHLFAPKGKQKYWAKASLELQSLGKCIVFDTSQPPFLISLCGRYCLFLVLDKVVCPFLVKYFEMPIWHPSSE
jgi:hypothetical protein